MAMLTKLIKRTHWNAPEIDHPTPAYSLRGIRRAHRRAYPGMYMALAAQKAAARVSAKRAAERVVPGKTKAVLRALSAVPGLFAKGLRGVFARKGAR